jgi:GxxExxY protein
MISHEKPQETQNTESNETQAGSYLPVGIISPRMDLADGQVNAICDIVRETGFAIHKFFGSGFREKVYERSLVHRLTKAGLAVDVQARVMIHDEDGTELVEEAMDLIINRVLIVELKAIRQTTDNDIAQLLGYLKATSFRHGLLINFGGPKFFIRKYVL